MCGIFGTLGKRSDAFFSAAFDHLRHRGPDGEGRYTDQHCALGHLRLAIIDIEGGKQPMSAMNGRYHLTYNGELYNFKELRRQLEQKGHRFLTNSDTEVVLLAFVEYGVRAFEKFNGIFALAIWDTQSRTLTLCRDRMGVKPLYYAHDGADMAFASELRPLLSHHLIDRRRLDSKAISKYLLLRHCPGTDTIISGIRKVPAGTAMTFTTSGDVTSVNFWRPEARPSENQDIRETAEELRRVLQRTVDRQMIADVPVGILLSSGIDSAALASLASQNSPSIDTFTIDFAGDPEPEGRSAKSLSERIGARHHSLKVEQGDLAMAPAVIAANDEPVAGPSSLAYSMMFKRIRAAGVKVTLLGHGADELFGGYEHPAILAKIAALKGNFATRWLGGASLAALGSAFPRDTAIARSRRLWSHSDSDASAAYLALYGVFDEFDQSELLSGSRPLDQEPYPVLDPFLKAGFSQEDAIARYELGPWLTDDLLHRVDRMSMAHSTEARVPYLDNEVLDLALTFSQSLKSAKGEPKGILRMAVANDLPTESLRRKKRRFTTPLDRLFGDTLIHACRKLFSEDNALNENILVRDMQLRLLEFANMPSYRFLLRHHRLFSQYFARQIWALFTLHVWYKCVVEEVSPDDISGMLLGEWS